jgi:ubiquinone/menaquinone biosynthesis C-methylase UbiE
MHDHRQEFFDRLASDWDSGFSAEHLDRLSRIVDSMTIKPGSQILDLGCGTGVLFGYLKRKVGESGGIVGVDFSLRMACAARRNFPAENINVIAADVSALPFTDRRFDLAVAFQSFPHFADKSKSLEEIHRVLKSGAAVWVVHLESSEELANHHRRHGGVVAGDVLPGPQEMTRLMTEHGFCRVVIRDDPHLYLASAVNT